MGRVRSEHLLELFKLAESIWNLLCDDHRWNLASWDVSSHAHELKPVSRQYDLLRIVISRLIAKEEGHVIFVAENG